MWKISNVTFKNGVLATLCPAGNQHIYPIEDFALKIKINNQGKPNKKQSQLLLCIQIYKWSVTRKTRSTEYMTSEFRSDIPDSQLLQTHF